MKKEDVEIYHSAGANTAVSYQGSSRSDASWTIEKSTQEAPVARMAPANWRQFFESWEAVLHVHEKMERVLLLLHCCCGIDISVATTSRWHVMCTYVLLCVKVKVYTHALT